MNMRQRPWTIITLTLLLLCVPMIALAQTPAELVLNPTSITGGGVATGQVSLSGPAPGGGRGVLLSSSNTAVATVPASVRVPAGQTTASFAVTTIPVTQSSTVTISAGVGGRPHAALTVVPPVLSSVTFESTNIVDRFAVAGQVSLSGPAPSGGLVVQLSSSIPDAARPVTSVAVPAGHKQASFLVTTDGAFAFAAPSTRVTITATAGGVTKTTQLSILPPGLSSVTLDRTSVSGGAGKVILNGRAPAGGIVVQLSSSNTAGATVPASVTVPIADKAVSFMVTIFPVPTAHVEPGSVVTITATAGGVTKTAQISITTPKKIPPPPPKLSKDCAACEKMCAVAGDAEKNPDAVAGCKADCKKTCQ